MLISAEYSVLMSLSSKLMKRLNPRTLHVPVRPVVHLPQLDVADDVVDAQDADILAGHVALDVAGQERAVVVVERDERVQRVAVGVDRGAAHAAVLVGYVVRLDGRRRRPGHRFFERAVRIVHLEGDVADAVAVHSQVVGRRVLGLSGVANTNRARPCAHHVGRHLALPVSRPEYANSENPNAFR